MKQEKLKVQLALGDQGGVNQRSHLNEKQLKHEVTYDEELLNAIPEQEEQQNGTIANSVLESPD